MARTTKIRPKLVIIHWKDPLNVVEELTHIAVDLTETLITMLSFYPCKSFFNSEESDPTWTVLLIPFPSDFFPSSFELCNICLGAFQENLPIQKHWEDVTDLCLPVVIGIIELNSGLLTQRAVFSQTKFMTFFQMCHLIQLNASQCCYHTLE